MFLPVQTWLAFCALCLAYLWAVGVPASELRPVALLLSAVCVVGLVADVVVLALE